MRMRQTPGEADTDNPVSRRSTIRSFRSVVSAALLVINVMGGFFVLFRHLNYLPFGAVGCLVAGLVLLATSWLFALRLRERIVLLLNRKNEDLKQGSITEALLASLDALETGVLITNIVALMFLTALAQMLSKR
jgi:hypothetical protein